MKNKRIIYTPSIFAKNNLLYLQETGISSTINTHEKGRDNLNSFLFFIVLDGKGSLAQNNKEYHLNKDDIVFIDCNTKYTQKSNKWTIQWIHFNGPTMNNIYEKYIERGGKPVFNTKQKKKYLTVLSNINNILYSDDHVKDMHLAEQLTVLLSLLMQDAWDNKKADKKETTTLNRIKDYINENYKQELNLQTIADTFYLNKFYLSREFKKQYDTTINNYIAQIRITKAKKLLRFSDKSITEIALEVGIQDPNYFARQFKKIEGMSPSEYKSKW